jgi:predicted TIM-barrel fold metal-dependent hydrolase
VIDDLSILDADAHVVEPGGLFDRWCPAGTPMDLPDTTPMQPCGDLALIADQLEHGFDPPSYLRAMDAQGIDGAVVYPSIGLFVPFQPELTGAESAAACAAYNDWVAGWCGHDPGRLAGIGILPMADLDLAAAEAQRIGERGLVGALVRPNHLYGRTLSAPDNDPVYAALAGAGVVLAIHEGLGLRGPTIGSDRYAGFGPRHACSHPLEQMTAMAGLFLEGTLDRHPDLRVAFLESGTGWLPYWLHRLDEHWEWLGDTECAAVERRPSDVFAGQCIISSEADDALVGATIARVGADHVVWASDFPHPDAIFPGAPAAFLQECEEQGVAREDAAAVLWQTPLAFYGLEKRFRARA